MSRLKTRPSCLQTSSSLQLAMGTYTSLWTQLMCSVRSFDGVRVPIHIFINIKLYARISPVWGLDDEGGLKDPWRALESLLRCMWRMMGALFAPLINFGEILTGGAGFR
ncbi:uncharacterized protein PHACADRAFT_203183 [Phanerochaete carnosa HHB-10118-sp]|uniref:Uncharacterized protein n=1 Tax=Phanerochaete carnosa (strain HHB-10118-sp) TaxID=650164 RepID=K5WD84_PHACS|nr:uncharacterized protein PHACADRAFT_203183 [Phanerochaete carnosa HHB-10118-sp]EKM48142.1 hypothetical protein PHACADRAFT_203183 [Phanerochaete carnosa HHB-10118-sp]